MLDTPAGIACDPGRRVWVIDRRKNSLFVFDAEGGLVTKQSDFGELGGRLSEPTGVALDAYGKIYIADTGNHRLVICRIAKEASAGP